MNDQIKIYNRVRLWLFVVVFCLLVCVSNKDFFGCLYNHDYINFMFLFFSNGSMALTISLILASFFEKWIWKWKIVNKFLDVPVLASSYACTFISDYDSKERKATLKIKQSFLKISVTFKTEESDSVSVIDAQIQDLENSKRLIYTYLNTPKANILDKSPIHYGTTILNISDSQKIEGDYFTIRKTKGHIECKAIKSPIA